MSRMTIAGLAALALGLIASGSSMAQPQTKTQTHKLSVKQQQAVVQAVQHLNRRSYLGIRIAPAAISRLAPTGALYGADNRPAYATCTATEVWGRRGRYTGIKTYVMVDLSRNKVRTFGSANGLQSAAQNLVRSERLYPYPRKF
jgi:hypothetical protein